MLLLDEVFSDFMVIPKNKIFSIGGTTDPNAFVTGFFDQQIVETYADKRGVYKLFFQPTNEEQKCFNISITSGNDKLTINNVQFGKVFLFAGQSNIEFKLHEDSNYNSIINSFSEKEIYFYNVPKVEFDDEKVGVIPSDITPSHWEKISKSNVMNVSAIAWFSTSKYLEIETENPIGIIDCTKGGTSASCWISKETIKDNSLLNDFFEVPYMNAIRNKSEDEFVRELEEYESKVNSHRCNIESFCSKNPMMELSEVKKIIGHTPWPPPMHPRSFLRPGGLFETMFLKIKSMSVDSVVWYQGENDVQNHAIYFLLMKTLITTWREEFNDYSLPFFLIQLPGYSDGEYDWWARIRQVQLEIAMRIPNVHLVSIADTGEKHNIHPADKMESGERLGSFLANSNYWSTPLIKKYKMVKNKLILEVEYAKQLKVLKNTTMSIFTDEQELIELPVTIDNTENNTLILEIPSSLIATQIRYGWDNFPSLKIYNEYDMPLSPFLICVGGKV